MRPASIFALLPAVTIALPTTETTGYELAKAIIARTAPPEAKVVLKSVTSSGSGCAANSAAFVFKDDATLAFDAMLISGSDATKTKKCLITMDLQLDSKWQYTINKATDVRGFAQGDGGASYKVTYTAGGKTASVGDVIKPTSSGNWASHSTSDGVTSAPGGGVASIDVSLVLSPSANSTEVAVTIDTLDIKFDYTKA